MNNSADKEYWQLLWIDILTLRKRRGFHGFHEAIGSTSSRIPAGSCCRPLLRFARQASPVCPTVIFISSFKNLFILSSNIYHCLVFAIHGIQLLKDLISLTHSLMSNFTKYHRFYEKKSLSLYPAPSEVSGFYGQMDKRKQEIRLCR